MTWSEGMPRRCDTESRMRWFACGSGAGGDEDALAVVRHTGLHLASAGAGLRSGRAGQGVVAPGLRRCQLRGQCACPQLQGHLRAAQVRAAHAAMHACTHMCPRAQKAGLVCSQRGVGRTLQARTWCKTSHCICSFCIPALASAFSMTCEQAAAHAAPPVGVRWRWCSSSSVCQLWHGRITPQCHGACARVYARARTCPASWHAPGAPTALRT